MSHVGAIYAPRSQDEIFKALREAKYTAQLTLLVERFLAHFKSKIRDEAMSALRTSIGNGSEVNNLSFNSAPGDDDVICSLAPGLDTFRPLPYWNGN